jgi:peptidase S46-like protein
MERGRSRVPPFTTLGGLYEHQTGSPPFALPARWTTRKPFVALSTPFNLVADTDIIGGNSGSPMIDRTGRIVGLVFDGNIHSIGGVYWFDPSKNRTVAVDTRGIREALQSVYQADRVVQEIDAR